MDSEYLDSEPIIVPMEQLSDDALAGLIEAFINREGTDYGEMEWTLAEKVAQVRVQLQRREAVIVFDPLTESCSIVPRTAVPRSTLDNF